MTVRIGAVDCEAAEHACVDPRYRLFTLDCGKRSYRVKISTGHHESLCSCRRPGRTVYVAESCRHIRAVETMLAR